MARIRVGTSYATEATGFVADLPNGAEAWKLERRSKSQGGGVEIHWLIKEIVPQVPPTLTEEQLDQIAEQIEAQRAALRGDVAPEPEYIEKTYEEIDAEAARRIIEQRGGGQVLDVEAAWHKEVRERIADDDVPVAAV